jgi:stage II sporulation protein P
MASGGPLVAIYHSHAMESYLPLVKQVSAGSTGKMNAEEAFADDPEITVVRAGQELANILATKYAIPNVHSRRFHDAGGRVGAYVESATTIERLLAQYPTIKVLLDLHRDSPRRAATTATVGGQSVARILLLVGSSVTLQHPNWRANLAFANKLHEVMERLYPGLSRGVMVKESRYNQHYLPHSVLVELGGVDNSMGEVLTSVRLFAEVLMVALREDTTANWPAPQTERK